MTEPVADMAPLSAKVGRTRRWWLIAAAFALPLISYAAVYFVCCERLTTRDMQDYMPLKTLDRHLLVLAPKGTCSWFFPVACVEAMVRGCWRGVLVNDRHGAQWDLRSHPWHFSSRATWDDERP